METKQETKSLPRNRKCGNCRYFEPAPLWRKGWCRNPRLYDRRANHLVDAATIDCEQVFRARIYWEPVPTSEVAEINAGYNSSLGNNANPSADSGLVDAGVSRGRVPTDGVLRPRGPALPNNPVQPNGMPVITRREKADAAPGVVRKPSQTRRWLVENIPYYDKIDGPISRINFIRVLPWIVVLALLLFVLSNVLGGKKEQVANTAPQGTVTASSNALLIGNATHSVGPTQTQATASDTKNLVPPTVTISNLVPTSTPTPPTPVTTQAAVTQARVNGTDGVNLRKEPGTGPASTILTRIAPGKLVTIRSAERKTVEGGSWWPVSYNGQDGWILGTFLDAIPAS